MPCHCRLGRRSALFSRLRPPHASRRLSAPPVTVPSVFPVPERVRSALPTSCSRKLKPKPVTTWVPRRRHPAVLGCSRELDAPARPAGHLPKGKVQSIGPNCPCCTRARPTHHSVTLLCARMTEVSMSIGWYLIPRSSMASSRAPTTCRASCRSVGDKGHDSHCELLEPLTGKAKTTPDWDTKEGSPSWAQQLLLRGSLWPRPRDDASRSASPARQQHLHGPARGASRCRGLSPAHPVTHPQRHRLAPAGGACLSPQRLPGHKVGTHP